MWEVGKEGDVISENKPILLYVEKVTNNPVRCNDVAGNSSESLAENLLDGILIHSSIPDDGMAYYQLDTQSITATMVRQAIGSRQTANRVCLSLATTTSERLDLKEGTDTSILSNVILDDESAETVIYDLQGRRVVTPEAGKIYVVNGGKCLYLQN